MNNANIDWSQYKRVPGVETAEPDSTEIDWSQYKRLPSSEPSQQQPQQTQGIVGETAKAGGRILGKTGSALVSAPAKGLGEVAQFASSLIPTEGEGQETSADPEWLQSLRQNLFGQRNPQNPLPKLLDNLGQFLQQTGKGGEEFLNQQLEQALGGSTSGVEDTLTQLGQRGGDIFGKAPAAGLAVPAAGAAISGQLAQEAGLGEGAQTAAEVLGSFGREAPAAIEALSKVPQKAKSGLNLPRVVEKTDDGRRLIKPRVFSGSKEKVYKKVSDQAESLLNEMKSEALPISKQLEEGINVEANLKKDFSKVQKIASELPIEIDSRYIGNYLDNVTDKINSVPVSTEEQAEILKLVKKYGDKFGILEGGTRFYTPKQYVDQYRNLNADAKKLYETSLLKGKQTETISFYEGLKDAINDTFEAGAPEDFAKLFKETNERYSQLNRLTQFESTLESLTKDGVLNPKKMQTILRSPTKSKALRRQLGDKGFNNFKMLSDDLSKTQDKLKLIEEYGLKDVVKSGLVGKFLKTLSPKLGIPAQVAKKGIESTYGYFLLNPQGSRDLNNFLKATKAGSKKAMATYLTRMDKNAQKFEDQSQKTNTE